MTTDDVKPGDEVKNGRSGAWGRVVKTQVIDGAVVRVKVQWSLGGGRFLHEPTWWAADSISIRQRKP